MSLRVCLVIPTLVQGGAEKQLTLLARGLAQHDVEPIVVVLTHTGPREKDLVEAGVQVKHIRKRLKLDPFAWNRLRRLLIELKPDVVHTWIFAANAYGRSAALAAGVPVILGSERSVDPWKSWGQLWIDRQLAKRTNGLTANSRGTIDFYASKGVPRDRFLLIPNGIEPSTSPSISRDEAFTRMGVALDRKVILSVGRLWHQKGYKDLIWSAELLRVMRGDLSYVIIGEGPERQRIEQYRDNIQGHEFVKILGERSDVGSLMPHCDVLWNGSLYEGQSNVIMEAMQLGLPVIASDIPGNRELIDHEKTGLIFKLGQVEDLTRITHQLLDNSEQRASLVASAMQHIQNEHSVEGMVRKHVELYRAKVASK